MDTPSGTLEVPQNSLSSGSGSNVGSDYKQVACFFGDLAHKKSVVGHFQQLGPAVVSYFSSLHRAWYVRAHRPDLVPDGITNVKKLAEIFEFQYQTSVPFTFGYDSWLPETLSRAPTDEEASASGYLLNWLSRSSVAKLPHAELADAMAQFDFQHPRAREVFEFPLDQIDPGIWIPATQDAQVQLDWALEARFHFGYPDICGYVRGGNGYTPGDSSPWFMSSRSRLNGLGCIGIRFPPKRSIFDNDPPGSHNDRWPVDGLWHPNNEHSFLGFKVHIWVLGWQTKFTDPLFNGPYFTTVVPKSRADLGLFVDFAGEPGQVAYFIVRRDVIWSSGRWDPPPDYPGNEPNPHIEL